MDWQGRQLYELIADFSHDLLSVSKVNGSLLYVNPSVQRYGYVPSKMIGTDSYRYIHDADLALVAQAFSLLEHTGIQTTRYRFIRGDGGVAWVETTFRLTPDNLVVAVTRDIENHKAEEAKIRTLAADLEMANRRLEDLVMVDHLTGIGNRRKAMGKIDAAVQEAERGRPLSVMMFDIDNFKSFNDAYGHQAGDEAIRTVAETFRDAIRRIDCVARYGGEEFIVISSVGAMGGLVLAEKLRAAVEQTKVPWRKITVSGGLAVHSSGQTASDIIGNADKALYLAKTNGRNRICLAE